MPAEEIRVSFNTDEQSEARKLRSTMKKAGVKDVKLRDFSGALGVTDGPAYAVVGLLAIRQLPDLWNQIRKSLQCREYIFVAPNREISIQRDCSIRDGRLIFFYSPAHERVEVHDVPPSLDVTKLAETIVTSGADALKAAAEALGAKVDGPFRKGERSPTDER